MTITFGRALAGRDVTVFAAVEACRTLAAELPGTRVRYRVDAGADPEVLRGAHLAGASFEVADLVRASACLAAGALPADLVLADGVVAKDGFAALTRLGARRVVVGSVHQLVRLAAACPDAHVLASGPDAADTLVLADQLGLHPAGLRVPLRWCAPGSWPVDLARAAHELAEVRRRRVVPDELDLGDGFPSMSTDDEETLRLGRLVREALTSVFGPRVPRTTLTAGLPVLEQAWTTAAGW